MIKTPEMSRDLEILLERERERERESSASRTKRHNYLESVSSKFDTDAPLPARLRFGLVLIDEAAQATEGACLVPLAHASGCSQLVLVGDQMQLPPTAPLPRDSSICLVVSRRETSSRHEGTHPAL